MRLKLLSVLDEQKVQLYHFKVIIVAGMGLFTDAYDFFCIGPITVLVGRVYFDNYTLPAFLQSIMLAATFLGAMIGQLVFGRLGDVVGRRRLYGVALLIMVLNSIGCGFSACTTPNCVLVSLAVFRFLLGLGIGGDYPLSATIMSEFANKMTRGAFMAAVFRMQGFGILTASTVTMVVCKIFEARSGTRPTPKEADTAWRLILVLVAIPAMLTFYWRMMMPETARYTALVQRTISQATMDMERMLNLSTDELAKDKLLPPSTQQYSLFSKQFFRCHGRDLFSCACSWFLVEVVFYSSNLFQPAMYKQELTRESAFEEAFKASKDQAISVALSTIPAYWFAVYFIDRIGRVKIQTMGFTLLTMVYLAMGITFNTYWKRHMGIGFAALYGLSFFFLNFGPNTTTFIVPAELFPARFRSTCHGISGAAGKLGAGIGSFAFFWVLRNHDCRHKAFGQTLCCKDCYPEAFGHAPCYGDCYPKALKLSLLILAGVCAVGAVVSFVFTPETNGKSLEDNEKDDEPSQLSLHKYLSDGSR